MYYLGVDLGSLSCDAVLIDDDENILASSVVPTGARNQEAIARAVADVIQTVGISEKDISTTISTGYGRDRVDTKLAAVTEITCHAKGIQALLNGTQLLIDIGGQDSKAIRLDGEGRVVEFAMNDKCAAGTGRGMEVFADLLQIPIEQIGEVSLKVAQEPEPVSCTCVAFAKTEAMGLLRKGWSKEKVLAAYTRAMAVRMANLINRVGLERELVVTGGQSKNIGIVSRIEENLGVKTLPSPNWRGNGLDPMVAGAIGAALLGRALYLKSQGG